MQLPWVLTLKQAEIFRATERNLVLVAGRRFGKTVLAITWLIAEIMGREEGALGYYVAPYRVMAKSIAWDMLLLATSGLREAKNETELSVTLPGMRKVALKGADDPETLEGVGLVAVVLDEFGRMKLDAWEKSIRPALSDKPGRALICGKPRGHNHLKDFYDRGQDRSQREWRSWLYRTVDGGRVPSADIAEAQQNLPPKVYRQEYEATFESVAGRVYEDFSRRSHVLDHAEIVRRYCPSGQWQLRRIIGAIDWGYVDPGVLLSIGVTATGTIVVIDEQYRSGMLVDAGGWLAIYREARDQYRYSEIVADPSEPGFIQATRVSLGGRPVVRGANNDWREGHRRVATALIDKRHTGEPGLIISSRCSNLIREMETHVFRDVRGVQSEQPENGNDHALDALRYGVMALS